MDLGNGVSSPAASYKIEATTKMNSTITPGPYESPDLAVTTKEEIEGNFIIEKDKCLMKYKMEKNRV